MADTNVGSVSYNVKINTADVKRQAAEVEKIVQDMYKNVDKANRKSRSSVPATAPTTRTPSSPSSRPSPAGSSSTSAATEAIASTRAAAQAQLAAISQATPQIQAQFLAVERANARVTAATTASTNAITKFGADSTQAVGSTDRLKNALLSQSQAQTRLQQAQEGTSNSLIRTSNQADNANQSFTTLSRIGIGALVAASVAAVATIASNLGDAISRFDTLNNAPKVLQNLGNSAEDSASALSYLDQSIRGLPTSLDSAVSALTRISAASGLSAKSSAALTIAFNNMALAGGRGPAEAERALTQFTQALSKGTLPAQEFQTLLEVMPAQLLQVSQTLLGAGANAYNLRDAVNEGDISINDFVSTIIRLNGEGGANFASFAQQAKDGTAGVQTGIINARTAIVRGIEGILDAIGGANIQSAIESVGNTVGNVSRIVANGATFIANNWQVIGPIVRNLSALAAILISTSLAIQVVGRVSAASTAVIGTLNLLFTAQRAAAAAAAAGNITLATSLLATRAAALRAVAVFGVVGLVLAALGFIAGEVLGGLGNDVAAIEPPAVDVNDALSEIAGQDFGGAADSAKDLGKQLAKLDEQANKIREDFRYQLAELVASKDEQVAQLRSQLQDEENAYNASYAKRLTAFQKSALSEEVEYGKRTRALQTQIDFLQRYNNSYNAQKLSQLQFALARENTEFAKQSDLRQQEYDLETQTAAAEYEKRRAENEIKLNAELALLQKHREDILGVRNIILLDEIEKLKQSRDEQLKSLQQQRNDLINELGSAGSTAGAIAGSNAAKAFNKAFGAEGIYFDAPTKYDVQKIGGKTYVTPQFATGGFTGRGGINDEAGVVHRGEYVVPQSLVDQSTGIPKLGALANSLGITAVPGRSPSSAQPSVTNNITISGVFATSASEQRKIADVIAARLQETQRSKGYA